MDICWSRDLNYNNGIPKSNCQLKIRKIKGCFGSLSFSLSVYDQKFVWGGHFLRPLGTIGLSK